MLSRAATSTFFPYTTLFRSGSAGTAIINQGTLTHTGGSSSIYAPTFTNSGARSEEHTSQLQSRLDIVSRLLPGKDTITVNGTSTTAYIRGNFSNNGTMIAQN